MSTQFLQLVSRGESEDLEFKKSIAEKSEAAKTVSAMLNSPRGGLVLVGVLDDGTLQGIEIGHETHDRLRGEFAKIDPPFLPDFETFPLEHARAVLIIRVPGNTGLYKYDGRVYMRFGASTIKMPEGIYQSRLIERMHSTTRWENQPAFGISHGDLDARELVTTLDTAISNGRLANPNTREVLPLLRGFNLIGDEETLLHAAAVLFGKPGMLERQYPQCRLRLARFRGKTKSEFTDNRQIVGNVFMLFQQAQSFLLDHIQIAGRVDPDQFERIDTPAYPLEALREALANALCHRDYAEAGGAIDLAIYDDRIEIVSSGPLRFGMAVEDLVQEHQSRPWNPIIAQVLYKRGMIESWGRGTLKMIEAARNVGLIAPEFVNTNLSFTVRFRAEEYVPPTRVSHDLTELQREILSKLRSLGPSTSTTVANALTDASDQRAVLRNLQALRDYGLVTLAGQYKAARWRLAHDLLENP